MKDDNQAPPPRRGGRPSRADAEQLGETILDVATQLFLADGYGATSIEAIVERAQISKRTFYHRFADKSVLFAAVVHRIIERLRPPAGTPLYDGGSLEVILRRLAGLIVHAAVNPAVLALNRLIVSEALRFPDLAAAVAAEGAGAGAIREISELLRREASAGRVAVIDPVFAAAQFMQLVIAVPQRRALGLGTPMTAAELDIWADDAVTLFIHGCRGEPAAAQ